MHLEQIDHVALTCVSPDATGAWYVRVLGFEHVYPDQWGGVPIYLRLGSTFIALFPSKGVSRESTPADIRFSHLAFRAATHEDFEDAQRSLRDANVAFQFQDHGIAHSIYFSDPDGHELEITTYLISAMSV